MAAALGKLDDHFAHSALGDLQGLLCLCHAQIPAIRQHAAAQQLTLLDRVEAEAQSLRGRAEGQFVRQGERLADDLIGIALCILSGAGPADLDAASVRHVAECLRCIKGTVG